MQTDIFTATPPRSPLGAAGFLLAEGFACLNPFEPVTEWIAPHLAEHGLSVTATVGSYLFKIDVHRGNQFILELGKRKGSALALHASDVQDLAALPSIIDAYTYIVALASRLEAYLAAQTQEYAP